MDTSTIIGIISLVLQSITILPYLAILVMPKSFWNLRYVKLLIVKISNYITTKINIVKYEQSPVIDTIQNQSKNNK